jgi:hypothetical protein
MDDLKLDRGVLYAEVRKLGGKQVVIDALELLDDAELTWLMFFFAEVMDTGMSAAFGRLDTYRATLDRLPDARCDVIARFAVELDDRAAKTSERYVFN